MTTSSAERITSPFGHRSTALEVISGHDLTGKTVLITGASSGLGVETARAFTHAGATVVLPVRDQSRGEESLRAIATTENIDKVMLRSLDLASLSSVRAFTEQFLSDFSTLDILINNAAVMTTPETKTADGFEMQFGTNHLGHFALFTGIAPALLAAQTSRVVALSSIGHRLSPVVFDDIMFENRPYEKWSSYGQSKTACALFAVGVSALYSNQGITANAVHPGGIITGLQKYLPREEQIAMGWFNEEGVINERFKNVEQGASTSTWAAVGVELEGRGGHYLEDCAQALPASKDVPMGGVQDYAIDPELAMKLWDVSSELIAK